MTEHSIEAVAKMDGKLKLKLKGVIYDLKECKNPPVEITSEVLGEDKNLMGSFFRLYHRMPLSKFLHEWEIYQHSAYSFMDHRPDEYSTSLIMKKIKERRK